MTLFERLERARRVVELAGVGRYDRYADAGLALNGHVLAAEYDAARARANPEVYAQGMAAQQQRGEPPPKGKWIATIANHWADDDDPERAVAKLEKKVVDLVAAHLDSTIAERTKRLDEARELVTKVNAITALPGPSAAAGLVSDTA